MSESEVIRRYKYKYKKECKMFNPQLLELASETSFNVAGPVTVNTKFNIK